MSSLEVRGRLVMDGSVVTGRIRIEDEWISGVDLDDDPAGPRPARTDDGGEGALPLIAPGLVDIHVHGWGGHAAMGSTDDLDGMARSLLRRGVTSFLPTAVTAPLGDLRAFADRVRVWIPRSARDGAGPLGFNLEGPFLAPERKGAHNPDHLARPGDTAWAEIEPLVDGLRLITIAPELDGALELIRRLAGLGVRVSLGHSATEIATAHAGYDAGATATTHLFNAMSGVVHRHPGLAVAALTRDDAYVELIADREHVDPALWPIVRRMKPRDRLILISDALALAGTGDGRMSLGGLEVEVRGTRCTLPDGTLAGSVIAIDTAVRNMVAEGMDLVDAVAAASRNPLAMLGIEDRGRLAEGQRADLVELDGDLEVRGVMRSGAWLGS
ncbi:MAG: N-acetylglucosamine-6-phosphate deacetylase [Chloroflexota bacterium]|nr:MAG: N-acetylglucosamine-6-phosphate deacetylase [Chloroflexota bacterium]